LNYLIIRILDPYGFTSHLGTLAIIPFFLQLNFFYAEKVTGEGYIS